MLGIFIAIFVLAISGFGILYLKFIYDSSYWKRRGISGPSHLKTNSIENQAPWVFSYEYPNVLLFRDWTKKYGPIFGYNEGQRKVLVTSDPEIAHEVMVKKFEYFHGRKLNPIVGNVEKDSRVHVFNAKGARWKRLRTTASPCFNGASLKKILPTIQDCANVTFSFLEKAHDENKMPFNIHSFFQEFTLDVISRVALGQKESRQFDNPNLELVKEVMYKFANNPVDYAAHVFPSYGHIFRKILFTLGKFKHVPIKDLVDHLYKTVDIRKNERNTNDNIDESSVDFIDLILDVEDNTVVDGAFEKTNMKVSKKLTNEEVTAQCFIFIIAGFDTTANTLANTAWFLAKNPKVQEKLMEEIDDVCGDRKEITYEELGSMRYADVVMKETLRFVPVAAFAASRECQTPTTIGPGIAIGKDVCVALDLYTLHFDKKIWGEDADEFKPERFFDFTPLQQMAYYPFGGGPRLCVGMRLAYLEEKIILAKILQKYFIRDCAETSKTLRQLGNTITAPEHVNVILEKRF